MDLNDKDRDILRWLDEDQIQIGAENPDVTREQEQLQPILEAIDQWKVPSIDEDILFDKIEQQINKNQKSGMVIPLWGIVSSVAAIFAIVIFYVFGMSHQIEVHTDDELLTHMLPDQSEVILNTKSTIHYDQKFNEERVVNLKGEAFFNVEKGKKFIVKTAKGKVEVLGTSFNVNTFNEAFIVACKTGKVKVSAYGHEAILTPGKYIALNQNGDRLEKDVEVSTIDHWTNSTLHFSDELLENVIEQLESLYNIEIDLPPQYKTQRYSGFIVKNDLKSALKSVFIPMNIRYELTDQNKVVILD